MIWVVRNPKTSSQVAAQWLIQRFIDPEASFTTPDSLPLSKRRNGTSGTSDPPLNRAFTELTSFGHLLREHGLAADPALLFLSDFLNSPHLRSLLASTDSSAQPPALAGSNSGQDSKQQAFALLDALYEWLREQVQGDLDRT